MPRSLPLFVIEGTVISQPVFLTTRAGLSFAIDASAWLSRVAICSARLDCAREDG